MSAAIRSKSLYLLDTNTVGYIASGRSPVARSRMAEAIQNSSIAISAITEGEILYGLARRPEASRQRISIEALLGSIVILPWDSKAAQAYGLLRARMTMAGKTLANLDMLIAAHAVACGAILVTRDSAFANAQTLHPVVNWATDI